MQKNMFPTGMTSWTLFKVTTKNDTDTEHAKQELPQCEEWMPLTDQNIDVSTFSDMQKCGYNMIKAHSEQPYPKDPFLVV